MSGEKKSGDDYLFEVTSFLIMSTKKCLGPEYMYCPTRLIQTLNLLSLLPDYVPELKGNKFLMKIHVFVEQNPRWWAVDEQKKIIEELTYELLEEIKKRLS